MSCWGRLHPPYRRLINNIKKNRSEGGKQDELKVPKWTKKFMYSSLAMWFFPLYCQQNSQLHVKKKQGQQWRKVGWERNREREVKKKKDHNKHGGIKYRKFFFYPPSAFTPRFNFFCVMTTNYIQQVLPQLFRLQEERY